jgi:hypothetical protein
VTPGELELCRRVGLVEETAQGVFALTYAGRKLLGEKPSVPRKETHEQWLARVEAMRAERSKS